jgi:bifunctional UDP-N-acetylglucosamine pyrophosphorylase/glucosamine-1-phosphate N-acetyltransferase
MLKEIQAIILAAGKSTRFNTGKTKLVEKICGQELIIYPLKVLQELDIPTTVVVGYQKELITQTVSRYCNNVQFIEQQEQLGTGHATKMTRPIWDHKYVLLMKADIPLITSKIIQDLFEQHLQTNAALTFITAHNDNPTGFSYGRVHKTPDNRITIIRPHEISKEKIQDFCCINGGIMIVNREFLETAVDKIARRGHSNEFHMSDFINVASAENKTVTMFDVPFDYVRGINNFQELWAAEQIKRAELIRYWMDRGVRFITPQSAHMELNVEIGAGTVVGCGAHLLAGTKIGKDCIISSSSMIENSTIGDKVTIHPHTIIRGATIHSHAQVGPFAHIQEGTTIGEHSEIGNFVEVKRTTIGSHSKAKHLSYLGDATIGSHVNIGAGSITCNYDGKQKHATIIKDYVFIGTNNSLVAPVTINERAFTAAGSVITQDVPQDALAIGRARQVNKEGFSKKLRAKQTLSFMGAVKTTNETSHEA